MPSGQHGQIVGGESRRIAPTRSDDHRQLGTRFWQCLWEAPADILPGRILESVYGGDSETPVITDKAQQNSAIDLLLFNQLFTATANKSAIAINSADMQNCFGVLSFTTGMYANLAASTNSVATYSGVLPLGYDLSAQTTTIAIYGQLVCRGTPTYASASDIQVALHLLLD